MSALRRKLPILFWAALVFAFLVAINPHPPDLPGRPSDKIQHIAAFVTLTTLALLAYPKAPRRTILIGLSAYGALIEATQAIPALHRDAELLDWVADTAAIIVILLAARMLRRT